MLYILLGIILLLIGLIIAASEFDNLPEVIKNLLDTIDKNVEPHQNLIGWFGFFVGIITLITGPTTIIMSILSILLGIYILNDELLKIPSIGELLHNLSDGLRNYKKALAILGIVLGILSLFGGHF